MNQVLGLTFTFLLAFPAFAKSNLTVNLESLTPSLRNYVESLQGDGFSAEMNRLFPQANDQAFIKKVMASKKGHDDFKITVTARNEIKISAARHKDLVLSSFDLKNSTVKINGVKFVIDRQESFESIATRIQKLRPSNPAANFFEIAVPKVHAIGGLALSLIAVIPASVAAVGALNYFEFKEKDDLLNAADKACKERNLKTPYDKSDTDFFFQQLMAKKMITSEDEVRNVASCKHYAQAPRDGNWASVETIERRCETAKRFLSCVDSYKEAQGISNGAPVNQKRPSVIHNQ